MEEFRVYKDADLRSVAILEKHSHWKELVVWLCDVILWSAMCFMIWFMMLWCVLWYDLWCCDVFYDVIYDMWYVYDVIYDIWYDLWSVSVFYDMIYDMWYVYDVIYDLWYVYDMIYDTWYDLWSLSVFDDVILWSAMCFMIWFMMLWCVIWCPLWSVMCFMMCFDQRDIVSGWTGGFQATIYADLSQDGELESLHPDNLIGDHVKHRDLIVGTRNTCMYFWRERFWLVKTCF